MGHDRARGLGQEVLYKQLKNVRCEYDRLNGRHSTLQAAWYIHVSIYDNVWCL